MLLNMSDSLPFHNYLVPEVKKQKKKKEKKKALLSARLVQVTETHSASFDAGVFDVRTLATVTAAWLMGVVRCY